MEVFKADTNPFYAELSAIPLIAYNDFRRQTETLLAKESNHCATYFAHPIAGGYNFYLCIACDAEQEWLVYGHRLNPGENKQLESLSNTCPALYIYENEIFENYGVKFSNHPWHKPVRYPFNRADKTQDLHNYPFYKITSNELHEVGVGPIHAGVIEPGHFRFLCNGEKVLHLEIQLGYQHRGAEHIFLEKKSNIQRAVLCESIAGDTAIAHSIAYSQLIESLGGINTPEELQIDRTIALEMERVAIHIGDTAAMCVDVAYQLGQVVNEALRTIVINSTQLWCGNRFGKGLVRPGGTRYPLTLSLIETIQANLDDVDRRYFEMAGRIQNLPSVLARFDEIGIVTRKQALAIGAVGMAARVSGLCRDIRQSHPFQFFTQSKYKAVMQESGDVLARVQLRMEEVRVSLDLLRYLFALRKISCTNENISAPAANIKLNANRFCLSAVEAWRGEIVHCAITNSEGEIAHYKFKDPSFHNWMALALAVRNQEISDFPICNKSYNLSYCGNDL